MRDLRSLFLALALGAAPFAPSKSLGQTAQDTIYVDQSAQGAETGDSWGDAHNSLQDALSEARTNGEADRVWVTKDTYYPDEGSTVSPDDRSASFTVPDNTQVFGGFSGDEKSLDERVLTRGTGRTVLSGEIQQDSDSTNNAETVLTLSGGEIGDVTITEGYDADGAGAGVTTSGGELHHAAITDNTARRGAAIHATGTSELDVIKATGNHATIDGAVFLDGDTTSIEHLTVADNTAGQGANGIIAEDSEATIDDFVLGTNTTVDISQRVRATVDVSPYQESIPLDTAKVTLRHAAQDTVIAEQNITDGNATFLVDYQDDAAFTTDVLTSSTEHIDDTTSIALGSTDSTYTATPVLDRTDYRVTAETQGLTGGEQARLTIRDADGVLARDSVSNETTTYPVTTRDDQVTAAADATGHQHTTDTVLLTGAESQSASLSLTPWTYTNNVVSSDGDSLTATHDGTTLLDTAITQDTTTHQTSIADGVEPGETVTYTVVRDGNEASNTVTADTTDREKTFTLNPNQTTHTVNGDAIAANNGAGVAANVDITSLDGTILKELASDSNGDYSASGTFNGADTVIIEADTSGYDAATDTVALDQATVTATSELPLIEYTYNVDVQDTQGDALSNATVILDDSSHGAETDTADANGDAAVTASKQTGVNEYDDIPLTARLDGYTSTTDTVTANPTDRTKNRTLTLEDNVATATVQGNTDQEGITLPNADLTFTNADADTTVGSTTSDANGAYSFSTSYPDDQAYTLRVEATTGDHETLVKDVELGSTDSTYTRDFDLERLIHDVTITTKDDSTGGLIAANGSILDNGSTLASYTTSDGDTTVQINTAADQVTSTADTSNYDEDTATLSLGGTEDISVTNRLSPIVYTFTGTVTDTAGTSLAEAAVTLDDGDGNTVVDSTNTTGDYTINATVNDGVAEGETVDLTGDKDGYNPTTKNRTADPADRTKTADFSLTEETITYTVEGSVASSDGDNVSGNTVNVVNPSDDTVATTTANNASYSVDVTQDELNGDVATIQSNPPGYDEYTDQDTLSEGSNTHDITLQEILRDYQFTINDDQGNPVDSASIDIDETTSGDRDVTTLTTDGNGDASTTLSVDEQILSSDTLEVTVSKSGYQDLTFTDVVDNEAESFTKSLTPADNVDRITVTFNPKTVGNSLYSGGSYSGSLDYTVTTPDTSFSATGSTTADVPIGDGDDLTITHSDAEYISTFAVNNTDTEQSPFQVSGFPAEPDYQGTDSVSIGKSDLVNQYQLRVIPSTSPGGYDTQSEYSGELFDGRWHTRDGHTDLLGVITTERLDNQEPVPDSIITKMNDAYTAAKNQMSFLPINLVQKTYSETADIVNNRGENYDRTGIADQSPGNSLNTSNGYAEYAFSTYAENEVITTMKSEIYSSLTGIEKETNVLNDSGFKVDAKFLPKVIYSLESQNGF